MGKNAKQKKKRKLESFFHSASGSTSGLEIDEGALPEEEMAITARVLHRLSKEPELFHAKENKPVRIALHALMAAGVWNGGRGAGGSTAPTKVFVGNHELISTALKNGDWEIALDKIKELCRDHVKIKLGTLQRWVRECDGVYDASSSDVGVFLCLDAILRAADPRQVGCIARNMQSSSAPMSTSGVEVLHGGLIRHYPDWFIPTHDHDECRVDGSNDDKDKDVITSGSPFVCSYLTGPMRTPPNKYPQQIWSTEGTDPQTLEARAPLIFDEDVLKNNKRHMAGNEDEGESESECPNGDKTLPIQPQRIDCPFVQDAFVVASLLSDAECDRIIKFAERLGYDPDEPVSSVAAAAADSADMSSHAAARNERSVLAHACVWLADEHTMKTLHTRCRPFLGPGAIGLNARLRCYRYTPGAVYRPHIDGAWPPSGLDPAMDTRESYVYDTSRGRVLSRFTFLIYLNDDFDGGGTTFYAPAADEGVLETRAVRPRRGAALVFPHGATSAALHEGSAVLNGCKYVIRTEVLFEQERE